MTRPALLAAAFLLLGVSAASAQVRSATVSGVVLEAEARITVEGAAVTVVDRGRRAFTSRLGEFRFDELEPGIVVLRITHPGYRERTDSVAVAPGERVEVRLALSAQAIELEPIHVVARRNTLGTGITGRFPGMTRLEIDQVLPRTRHLADLVQAGNFVGVRVLEQSVPGVESGRVCVEHSRARTGVHGPNSCVSMNVYVDGRPVLDPAETFATMPPEMIERFEILSPLDAASVYGGAGARGLVLIETRSGTGVAERTLPVFTRDLAPYTVLVSALRGRPGEVYDGAAVLTYDQGVTTVQYRERAQARLGVRAGIRGRPFSSLPELELSGFWLGGEATATFPDGTGALEQETHDFSSTGVDLAVRPRITRQSRWDLSMVLGPVLVWESVSLKNPTSSSGLGGAVSERVQRSWTSVGIMLGGDFEWSLNPRSGILLGARWRALTAGESGEDITEEDALAGRELLQLPQARRRNSRWVFELGYVRRLGSLGS